MRTQDIARHCTERFGDLERKHAMDPRDEVLQKIEKVLAGVESLDITPVGAVISIGRIMAAHERQEVARAARS